MLLLQDWRKAVWAAFARRFPFFAFIALEQMYFSRKQIVVRKFQVLFVSVQTSQFYANPLFG